MKWLVDAPQHIYIEMVISDPSDPLDPIEGHQADCFIEPWQQATDLIHYIMGFVKLVYSCMNDNKP